MDSYIKSMILGETYSSCCKFGISLDIHVESGVRCSIMQLSVIIHNTGTYVTSASFTRITAIRLVFFDSSAAKTKTVLQLFISVSKQNVTYRSVNIAVYLNINLDNVFN